MRLIRVGRDAICGGLVVACLCVLAGCASTRTTAAKEAAARQATVTTRDARGAYRFDMSQNGRRMTADEFDAWMKANGIRIAKGAPAGSATRKAKAGGKPKATATKATAPRKVASAAADG